MTSLRQLGPAVETLPFNFYQLREDPPIILTFTMGAILNVRLMSRAIAAIPATFIVAFWWSTPTGNKLKPLKREHRAVRREFPRNRIHYLC
jgi:hypothetical protein